MTEFNTIKECMAAKEGNIRFTVIKAGNVLKKIPAKHEGLTSCAEIKLFHDYLGTPSKWVNL